MGMLTQKNLKEPGYLTGSTTAIYTVPASTRGYVKSIILHNTHTSATKQVTLHHVPSGGVAGGGNTLFNLYIAPEETLMIDFQGGGVIMDTGDTIQGKADETSYVSCAIYGAEEGLS